MVPRTGLADKGRVRSGESGFSLAKRASKNAVACFSEQHEARICNHTEL